MKRYVVYLRVNSGEQDRAEQAIELQEREIDLFLETIAPQPWRVIGRFAELRSEGDDDRPQLAAALALVRRTPGAELLVATLDRLAESEAFLAMLLDDPQVRLRAAAMSAAAPRQFSLFAVIAERERRLRSGSIQAAPAEARPKANKSGREQTRTAMPGAGRQGEPRMSSLRAQVLAFRAVAAQLRP